VLDAHVVAPLATVDADLERGGGGAVWVYAEGRDGTAKRPRRHHVQQEQELVRGAMVGGSSSSRGGEEVEAVAEDEVGAGPVLVLGGAGPAVVGKRRRRASVAAGLAGAAARRVRARPGVGLAVVVRRPVGAAGGGVRSRDADGAHQVLHVVAPAVAARRRGAALVALGRLPQLVGASAAHHVPDVALHTHASTY
jgi:hypothetical protein